MTKVPNHIWQIDDLIKADPNFPRLISADSFLTALINQGYGTYSEFSSIQEASQALVEIQHPCNLLVLMDLYDTEPPVNAGPSREWLFQLSETWSQRDLKRQAVGNLHIIYYSRRINSGLSEVMSRGPQGFIHGRSSGFPCAINFPANYAALCANGGLQVKGRGGLNTEMLEDWALMQPAVVPMALQMFYAALKRIPTQQAVAMIQAAAEFLGPRMPTQGPVVSWAAEVITLLSRYDSLFPLGEVPMFGETVSYIYEREPLLGDLPLYTWVDRITPLGLSPATRALIL